MGSKDNVLLEVNSLKKYFPVKSGLLKKTIAYIKAVDDISFNIKEGETLGLVGESGSGKTTAGRTILRLEEATSGEVKYMGKDILTLNQKDLREIRRQIQVVFQDPYGSLNPKMTVADIISESLYIHKLVRSKNERNKRIKNLLQSVGLSIHQMDKYPHEFSGGQRQRIGIARALAVQPKVIIADEPVSALDVSIQAQIINLLQDLQEEYNLTYLFIAHDLSVVKHISDRVAVMYLGKIVELTSKKELYNNPLHPYTRSLLSAIPVPDPFYQKKRVVLVGDAPSPINPPSGCRFRTRCPEKINICSQKEPEFKDYVNEHSVACHLLD